MSRYIKQSKVIKLPEKYIIAFFIFFVLTAGLSAQQTLFPNGDFWALDAGVGMGGTLVSGEAFKAVIDPKISLTPALVLGNKWGLVYSLEDDSAATNSDIFTLETQVYLRWNFLRFGNPDNRINVFAQGGIGLMAAYRGVEKPFDDVTMTRGSFMAEGALGITYPFNERWHIEGQVGGGYPHIWSASVTAGYKFKMPEKTKYYREKPQVIKEISTNVIIQRMYVNAIEFILFGPDIGRYNIGIDKDAQQLNELVLNATAKMLKENPNYRVRVEGHANPYTINISEADELLALSAMRSHAVVEQLKKRGVKEDQIILISFGGTREASNEWDVRNRNRRVELMILQVNTDD